MKKSKDLTLEERRRLEILQKRKNDDSIKSFIHEQTEAKSKKTKFSDQQLDAENEKQKILLETLEELWSAKNLGEKLLKVPSDYETIFTQEFYKEIFRLNNWEYKDSISKKPWKVAKYTNEIIYSRISTEVLPFLRLVNPYVIPGIRKYKHHQYLTPGARNEVARFIRESTEVMRKCGTWYKFRIKLHEVHGVPYQVELF
jgi:hypothetical protein